jgi:hypothetical protein
MLFSKRARPFMKKDASFYKIPPGVTAKRNSQVALSDNRHCF